MHTSDFLFSLAYIHKIYIYAIYFFSSKTLFVRTSVEKINTSVFSSWSPLGFSNQSYSFMFFVWFFCLSVQRVTLQKKRSEKFFRASEYLQSSLQLVWDSSTYYFCIKTLIQIANESTQLKLVKTGIHWKCTWVELKKDLQKPEQLSELDSGLKWVLRTLVIHVTHLWWWFSC